jgi:hypothetical protein
MLLLLKKFAQPRHGLGVGALADEKPLDFVADAGGDEDQHHADGDRTEGVPHRIAGGNGD